MKLTPATIPYGTKGNPNIPAMSVYINAIRFNKAAAALLDLPAFVTFDFEKGILTKDKDGFRVKICGSWSDYVIHNRNLTRYILDRFGKKNKAIFTITANGDNFRLKQAKSTIFE